MSPRYVNREEKTRMIARAALALYARKGFAATGVDQIAAAAGVGKGTLYEYFESKADIFVAAILEWMKQLTEQFADRLEKIDDPVQQLRAFTEMTIELVDPLDPPLPGFLLTSCRTPCLIHRRSVALLIPTLRHTSRVL